MYYFVIHVPYYTYGSKTTSITTSKITNVIYIFPKVHLPGYSPTTSVDISSVFSGIRWWAGGDGRSGLDVTLPASGHLSITTQSRLPLQHAKYLRPPGTVTCLTIQSRLPLQHAKYLRPPGTVTCLDLV